MGNKGSTIGLEGKDEGIYGSLVGLAGGQVLGWGRGLCTTLKTASARFRGLWGFGRGYHGAAALWAGVRDSVGAVQPCGVAEPGSSPPAPAGAAAPATHGFYPRRSPPPPRLSSPAPVPCPLVPTAVRPGPSLHSSSGNLRVRCAVLTPLPSPAGWPAVAPAAAGAGGTGGGRGARRGPE